MNKIPDNTIIQSIDLRVRDLKTSLEFYVNQLGLKEIERTDNEIYISSDGKYPYLFKLTEESNAPVRIKGTPGLYHIAVLFPDRKELARVFMRMFTNKIKFQGFSDHLVSEAIYLSDPDGNGIELYADRPRDTWVWKNGEVMMDSLPLDLSVITNELNDREVWNGIHPDTRLGHIHLNVSDLRKTEEFYNEILGFNISNYSYPGAKFFSAGGYHHHIAGNTWMTNKKLSRNEKSLGMTSFTIQLTNREYLGNLIEKISGTGNYIKGTDKELWMKDPDGILLKILS